MDNVDRSEAPNDVYAGEILAEQVRQAHSLAPFGIVATILNALIVYYMLQADVNSALLSGWLAAIIALSIVRIALLLKYRRTADRAGSSPAWRLVFLAGLSLSGALWGSLGIFSFPGLSLADDILIAFVLGGMSAGAAASFSVLKGGYLAYSIPALTPLVVHFILRQDRYHFAMAAMMLLYGVLLWKISSQHYRTNRTSLLLRYENRRMLDDLKSAKKRVEEMYRVVIEEVRERQKIEAQLRAQQEQLEGMVRERTAELSSANENLKLQIEERRRGEEERERLIVELERSNRELQQFAYVASHDLQEPLRTVASYVELLSKKYREKIDDTADRYISYAVEAASRMSSLINDLLAYSRVATGGHSFRHVDMNQVLRSVKANLGSAIVRSGAAVEGGDLPLVWADQSQMSQLLQNLVANALKFGRPNVRPEVRVACERRGGEWVFGVHDNGIGIDPRHHERIFTIFQRLHTAQEYSGTGVGLAICKRIVERHGGRMWVESRPGEGSSFYFTLTADRDSDSDEPAGGR